MKIKRLILPALALALTAMACTINLNLPTVRTIETGPTVTEDFSVPAPDSAATPVLEINFGAGRLEIAPGAESGLAQGVATYNVDEFKPAIKTTGSRVTLQPGDGRLEGLPAFSDELVNKWELKLSGEPMALRLNVGAAQWQAELGGLSLTQVTINQGASDFKLSFAEANLIPMDRMEVSAGASSMTMTGLANANIQEELVFTGGAGDYTLDFSGELQGDLTVMIDAGLGNVTVIVPAGVPAQAAFEGALTNVSPQGGWQKSGDQYTQAGEGYKITLRIKMGAGNLELSN